MVFCGKPSKGCTHCRTRRIKCDLVQPSCSQCLRAGKECPGYRDQLSLMFRDENEKVVTKARVPKPKPEPRKGSRAPGGPSSRSESACPPNRSQGQEMISRIPYLLSSPPAEDERIRFFLENYVTAGSQQAGSEYGFVGATMFQMIHHSSSFANAVSSVGYAGLSNVGKDPQHAIIARRKYAASLRDITRALGDVANSDLDATLKSVLLLAAFEIVNGSSRSIGVGPSWAVHIDGGAEILKVMASQEPHLLPTQRGWVQFIFAMYVKALSKGEGAPATMLEWCESWEQSLDPTDLPAMELAHIVCNITNLHASVRNKTLIDTNIIILETLTIDSALEEWHKALPSKWWFTVIPAPDTMQFTLGGQTHCYQERWVSRILNNYRWARILVNQVLLGYIGPLGSFAGEYGDQQKRSLEIISSLATDICVCVSANFRPNLSPEKTWNIPAMSGIFLDLFPLAVAGSAWGVSEELHHWVLNIMEYIGTRMGISQAIWMLDLIRLQRTAFEEGNIGSISCTLFGQM